MCGIAGILSGPSADPEALRDPLLRMLTALRHRGPDGEGFEIIGEPGSTQSALLLAHTRLAILDPSPAGRQPMRDPVTGNWIVFNGEIYNFKDLRAELDGDPWQSRTDTEVLLRAYRRWGESFLERLRGMFAFALWDARARRILLVRDPFGIKPLYYSIHGNRLVFASEVRALLASGLVDRRLDHRAVLSYLRFGSVEEPLTIIENVTALPPGEALWVRFDGAHLHTAVRPFADALSMEALGALENDISPLWGRGAKGDFAADHSEKSPSIPLFQRGRSSSGQLATGRGSHLERMRGILEDSVRAHLVSDVPVAAFLSGGIDSSAIVALMSRVAPEPPQTFSVVFAERAFSEAPYARLVAQRCGTQHTEVPLSEADLLGMLPAALAAMDQPTMDGVNTYVVSKAVRDAGIKVALSGVGGDELFGGYPSFGRALRLERTGSWLSTSRRLTARLIGLARDRSDRLAKASSLLEASTPQAVYLRSREVFTRERIRALSTLPAGEEETGHLPALPADADAFRQVSICELAHYMRNTLLRDTDSMSMAHSLEVRVPFVDRKVVHEVLGLPSSAKHDGNRPKPLLLDALAELIPEEVWRRQKQGFMLPFERWMMGRLRHNIDGAFADSAVLRRAGLDPAEVASLWGRFLGYPRGTGWARPWAVYVLVEWADMQRATC
jgi:asparagine synthase (glutamine-hydrolysing)